MLKKSRKDWKTGSDKIKAEGIIGWIVPDCFDQSQSLRNYDWGGRSSRFTTGMKELPKQTFRSLLEIHLRRHAEPTWSEEFMMLPQCGPKTLRLTVARLKSLGIRPVYKRMRKK